MRIPASAIIADEKLTRYLLVHRPWDDKSAYLAQAGFSPETPALLRNSIRQLAASVDAVEDGGNSYGTFYRTDGPLIGPTSTLDVTLVWIRQAKDGQFKFVTLKPRRR